MSVNNLEKSLKGLLCPCHGSYIDVEKDYSACKSAKTDCSVYKIMKIISSVDMGREEATEFVKHYKFV